MTASELISKLKALIEEKGDCDVLILDRDTYVWVEPTIVVDDGEEWFFHLEVDDD